MKLFASDVILDCSTCKLGKSKTLPFFMHDSLATHCFDLIHSNVWVSHQLFLIHIINILVHSLMIIVDSNDLFFTS